LAGVRPGKALPGLVYPQDGALPVEQAISATTESMIARPNASSRRMKRPIGIVLSGTGSDGTAGVRAIKGEGGMVIAQNPASAEYDGMPRSAVATGLVDCVLP
jgi:chemotaxis response regulator CheB